MQNGNGGEAEAETENPRGSLDPTVIARAAAGLFDHHPLFPREDGSPETRDIQFVSFCRKRAGERGEQNCAEDIPARDVTSWAQVVEWWGGGEYKAIAKDGKHRMIAWYPSTGGEWLSFDGDSKPFTLRNGKAYKAPTSAAQPLAEAPQAAPAPAPAAQEDVRGMLKEVLLELRNARAAPPPSPNDGALVAMIQAQAAQAAAASQAQAAQATAASQANAQMMQTLLTVVAQRPAENTAKPVEPTTMALQLIGAVQKLVPAPIAQPGLADQIPLIKALRDLSQPATVAPTSELQPFVDIFGQVMAADAARTQAEAARVNTTSKPQEPPAVRPPPRPRPALVHVPGVGVVEVVAPDAGAVRSGEMSIEERAAAIRKDPALLRELGLGLPPSAVAPVAPIAQAVPAPAVLVAPVAPVVPVASVIQTAPAPALPLSPVGPAVVASAPAMPIVPDLEPTLVPVVDTAPTPAAVVEATSLVASAAVSAASSVDTTMLPEPAPGVAASTTSTTMPTAPSVVAAEPGEPPASAPDERTPIALPERMPILEPPHAPELDQQQALGELKRLTTLSHEERAAALRKLPGIGAMADDVARIMASLPADAVTAMAHSLDIDTIRALAGSAHSITGG